MSSSDADAAAGRRRLLLLLRPEHYWLAVPRTYRVVAGSADNISDVSGARCRNDAPYLSISVNAGVELSCVESGHS